MHRYIIISCCNIQFCIVFFSHEQFDSHIVAAALQWRLRHAAHLATSPANGKRYTHFYNFVYVTLYREIREQLNAQSEREGRDQEAAICL